MKIKITDISPEGRNVAFPLDVVQLNERLDSPYRMDKGERSNAYRQHFNDAPRTELHLTLEGRTVMVRGRVSGTVGAMCARCTEPTTLELSQPVNVVLKPETDRSSDETEDVDYGFYDGREVDCDAVAQDALVEGIPYNFLCKEDCKGLCPSCGVNLNQGSCDCTEEKAHGDERFAILRGLKIQ
jgi:uncharacterized protein